MTRQYRRNTDKARLEYLTAFRMTREEAQFVTDLSGMSGLNRSTIIRCAVRGLRNAVVQYAQRKRSAQECQG